jgi:hypothetical protein
MDHRVCQKKKTIHLKPKVIPVDPLKEIEALKLENAALKGENKALKEINHTINITVTGEKCENQRSYSEIQSIML